MRATALLSRRHDELALTRWGHPQDPNVRNLTYRLAVAVSDYHFSSELGERKDALTAIHRIMLDLEGHMTEKTYHQHLAEAELEPNIWRPRAIAIAEALRFSPERFATVDAWHVGAKQLLAPLLPREAGDR